MEVGGGYPATAAGAGPASTSRFVTGSTRKFSPSKVHDPTLSPSLY